jgi:hypothetical protein
MRKNKNQKRKSKQLLTRPALCITTVLLLTVYFLPLAIASPSAPHLRLPTGSVTIITHDGDDSYFNIELSDVPADQDVQNADYEGWCADRFVVMPRNQQLTVHLYNNYEQSMPSSVYENWCMVNDILNHHNGVEKLDVQYAFWYLLSDYPYSSLSDAAKTLVDNADHEFVPQAGEWIAIFAEPFHNQSNPWPFQYSFLQVRVPQQESTQPETPVQSEGISHGYRYNDVAPTAVMNSPYNGFVNEPVMFSGAASVDPDGVIIRYQWGFGDGTYADTSTATHTYTHVGVYHVYLKVTDNFGLSHTVASDATISIRNSAPSDPVILGPVNGTINTNYSYAFRSTDQNHDDISYSIDWGDQTNMQTVTHPSGTYFSFLHHWSTPGTYTITVTASDGSLSATADKTIVINDTPLTENIWILGLAVLAIIILLAVLLYSRKIKNSL